MLGAATRFYDVLAPVNVMITSSAFGSYISPRIMLSKILSSLSQRQVRDLRLTAVPTGRGWVAAGCDLCAQCGWLFLFGYNLWGGAISRSAGCLAWLERSRFPRLLQEGRAQVTRWHRSRGAV